MEGENLWFLGYGPSERKLVKKTKQTVNLEPVEGKRVFCFCISIRVETLGDASVTIATHKALENALSRGVIECSENGEIFVLDYVDPGFSEDVKTITQVNHRQYDRRPALLENDDLSWRIPDNS